MRRAPWRYRLVVGHEQLRLEDELGTFDVVVAPAPQRSSAARAEIARMLAAGVGPTAIAESLNTRGVPTPSGRGRWRPETVLRHHDPARWSEYMRRYRARRAR